MNMDIQDRNMGGTAVYSSLAGVFPVRDFLCTRASKGNMSAKVDGRPAQRVVEKVIPLLNCTRTRKGNMQLKLSKSCARVIHITNDRNGGRK